MDKFIKKLNFDFATHQKMLQLIGLIDGFKGKWDAVERQENRYLKELRKIATIESIGSSTRIEGATLTDKEVQELLDNIKITEMKTRDEQEIVGYYEVLTLIYENYPEIKLSENYIKQLHQLLLKYSCKDERHRGRYKNLPNTVVATYPTNKQRVIFDTTEPALVEGEMFELIGWTNRQWQEKTLHPLVTLALFIYEFLSIHPFQDGNGRLSRLLTTLFLLQNKYEFISYISFENYIEQHKKTYYDALISGQRNRKTKNERIDKWLLFFLESLVTLTEKLEQKYNIFKSKGGYLNDRQKQIKTFITAAQPVKISDIANHFKEIPVSTIKKDLQYMRNEQILTMIGKNRGSVYLSGTTGEEIL
jgi:Fic family protein